MKSETLSLKTVVNKLVFVNSYYLVKHQKKISTTICNKINRKYT